MDFIHCILDEISLEGLDGITLETLWQRLKDRPQFPIAVDDDSKDFFWRNIAKLEDIEMYQLPKPREFVPIYNRYEHVDPEHETVCEPPVKIQDPHYPIVPINEGHIRGSCAAYETRRCVTSDIRYSTSVLMMSLEQVVEEWGDTLVLVASPKARLLALIGSETNPLTDLSIEEYCLLERIGRSRYLGEVTQGEGGLLSLKAVFCKHIHYYRKKLSSKGLITKQDHSVKTRRGITISGCLFHLKRFYVRRKTKMACLLTNVCDILKDKPQNREACTELKAQLCTKRSLFKNLLTKSSQKWLKASTITCKELYPNGTEKQWFTVNGQEKRVKVLQLIKHCDEEDSEEDSGDGEQASTLNVHFDYSKIDYGVPLLYQVYNLINRSGPEGISLPDLGRAMTLPKLEIRNLVRTLERKRYIFSVPRSRGRQTLHMYISTDYKNKSETYSNRKKQEDKLISNERVIELEEKLSVKERLNHKQIKSLSNKGIIKNEDKLLTNGGLKIFSLKRKLDHSDNSVNNSGMKRLLLDGDVQEVAVKKNEILVEKVMEEYIRKNLKYKVNEIPNSSQLITKPSEQFLTTESKFQKAFSSSKQFTYRKYKRCNIILDLLKKDCISTVSDLQKHILQLEKDEGYNFKLDKKSTTRLVNSLLAKDKIKKIVVEFEYESKKMEIEFLCDKSFQKSDPRLLLAIEQAKCKNFSASKDEKVNWPLEEKKNLINRPKTTIENSHNFEVPKQQLHKMESLSTYPRMTPKFVRVKVLHRFLYYLVYQHKKEAVTSNKQIVYHDSFSWKRFVPPVSDYGNPGWCLIADVFSSMPLSIFVQLVNFMAGIPHLKEFLENKERANYLIKYLPQSLRNHLMHRRKYLYSINGCIRILCYMGLVSLGPQVGNQKDQALLYVHKRATVKDTTVSSPGYIHVSADVEYVTKPYTFEREEDIENFWHDLETICFHTPLGIYSTAIGETLAIIQSSVKPELMECTKNINFDEVCDEGFVPGDGLGAAGYDSTLYLHIRRNWHVSTVGYNKSFDIPKKHAINSKRMEPSMVKLKQVAEDVIYSKLQNNSSFFPKEKHLNKDILSKTMGKKDKMKFEVNKVKEKQKRKFNASKEIEFKSEKNNNFKTENGKKPKVRNTNHSKITAEHQKSLLSIEENDKKISIKFKTIKERPSKRAPLYDKIDEFAISRLEKLRCHWTPQEDSFLLLCKVASCFLKPTSNREKIVVSYTTVRDLLHRNVPGVSADKTSRACQRRMRYMMMNPTTIDSVKVFLREALQDAELVKEFDVPKPPRTKATAWESMFTKLINILREKYTLSIMNTRKTSCIPRTVERFNELFDILTEHDIFERNKVYKSPCSIEEIEKYTLLYLVLSAMAVEDEDKWTSKFTEIYQKYPENVLQSIIAHLRKEQVISVKSKAHRSDIRRLYLSTCPYKFSVSYHNANIPKFPLQNFKEAKILLDSLKSLRPDSNVELLGDVPVGFTASVVSLLAIERLAIHVEIPEQVILIDSTLSKKAKTDIVERMGQTLSEKDTIELSKYLSNDGNFSIPNKEQFSNNLNSTQVLSNDAIENSNLTIINGEPQTCETQPSTKASRFALYLMRHEMSRSELEKEQHSQDYIVLNACRIFCSLKPCTSLTLPVNPTGINPIVPGSIKATNHTTKQWTKLKKENILDISNSLTCFIPPEVLVINVNYLDKIEEMYQQYLLQTIADAKQVFNNLYKAGTNGISETELWHRFSNLPGELSLFQHLHVLREAFLIVRVGVVAFTYVSCRFAKSWMLAASQPLENLSPLSAQFDCNKSNNNKIQVINNPKSTTTKNCRASTNYFIPRTWRNPDGSLNKPVLSDFLFTLLTNIITSPGISTSQVCERFSLILPPVQVLELLEVLEKAYCIHKYYCKPVGKVTLFSALPKTCVSLNPEPGDMDHIETFPDAICKIVELVDAII